MRAGDRYGHYDIVRLIGRGAMGEVYLARNLQSGLEVALKIVYKGPDPEDQEILAAERLGAELQRRLSGADRRVVIVNRLEELSGDLNIEMEFIEGEDLSAVIHRGPLDPRFAVYVAEELCEMLEHLRSFSTTIADQHFSGVVHGDLKPRNIRLTRQNQVKVLDFGIAKALSHTRKYTMNVFASTAYCSPERLETQNMDGASDLWSVGVLLYQIISGRLPFDEPNKERLERRIRSIQPPDPLPESCPEPLRRIVFKFLARDPNRRYQSASEAKEDLGRFRTAQPVHAELAPSAAPFESDATRRTIPAQPIAGPRPLAEDRTIRTASALPRSPVMTPFAAKSRRSQLLLGCLTTLGIAVLVMFGYAWMQVNFWRDADKLKTDLQSQSSPTLDDAWTRYKALTQRSHMNLLLWSTKRELRKRLIAAADQTISQYRNNDLVPVYLAQWINARTNLSRALELDPSDDGINGRERVTEGHINRIEAGNLRGPARQKKLNTAVTDFQEAADLLKHSPDPYLGLARLYVYDLNDVDKAEDALKNAARHGHPTGKRETAQLADAYRRDGDRYLRESLGYAHAPDQEREYLDKAKEDYIHAEDLYRKANFFGDAARNEGLAMQGQQRVEQILSSLPESDRSQ